MVAYSFNKMFAAPIASGRKRQTIRAARKRHARCGEALQLFTGMRTRQCRKLGDALCSGAYPIAIWFYKGEVRLGDAMSVIARTSAELNAFAQEDGFDHWAAMCAFWREAHPDAGDTFHGWLITWTDFKPSAELA